MFLDVPQPCLLLVIIHKKKSCSEQCCNMYNVVYWVSEDTDNPRYVYVSFMDEPSLICLPLDFPIIMLNVDIGM